MKNPSLNIISLHFCCPERFWDQIFCFIACLSVWTRKLEPNLQRKFHPFLWCFLKDSQLLSFSPHKYVDTTDSAKILAAKTQRYIKPNTMLIRFLWSVILAAKTQRYIKPNTMLIRFLWSVLGLFIHAQNRYFHSLTFTQFSDYSLTTK